MALGTVGVYSQNNGQGEFKTPERQLLYIGHAGKNAGSTLYIDQSSDLDELLGTNSSKMKTAIKFARINAGPNWTCISMPRGAAGEWYATFNQAMDENLVCEGVVVTDALADLTARDDIAAMHAAAVLALNEYGRRLFFMTATAAPDAADSWADFITTATGYANSIAADRVMLVPEVFSGFLGTLAGRLCNEAVSIADSPMRVKTGTLVGIDELPRDASGEQFNNSHAKTLNDARMTIPQTYADYAGIYCSDGMTLDVEAGDYQVIENLRVVDSAARKVRVLAIKQVANRELNSLPAAIAANETYFMRPLIDMSKSVQFNGVYMPGEVKPPQDGDIRIVWVNRTSVQVHMLARPYHSPKSIQAYIGLNLTNEVQ